MNYRNIESVEQLREIYHLPNRTNVNESQVQEKKGDGKANSNVEQTNFFKDKLPVEYADIKKISNIFKHIIIFTNDRDPKNNKTLGNILDCIKELKSAKCEIIPELHIFVAADVDSKEDESEITIHDDEETFTIKEENNTDTLVFSRLGVQDEYECEHIVKLLQDRGFLVLNPVQYSAIACNKYETAVLLQKGGIPQPNFTLMTKEILYDEKLFHKAMHDVYKDWDDKDKDKNEARELVIKILDGHGGTGVFLTNGKKFEAVLQALFAIDPERQLIIQKKEEADGGDIRVHVLTLNKKQVILAAMKRVKIASDFRSNVSLGATAEKVKLTPDQEQIALKTAKISKMPWCAVDIMPLVKGSNPELGDNAVLEINASPGTDGITDVIGENFVHVLLNELNDPREFYLQDKVAGYIEGVEIEWSEGVKKNYLAKLDTGNGAHASHIEVGEYEEKGNKVTFTVDGKSYTFDVVDHSHAKTGSDTEGTKEEANRPIIEIPSLRLGLRKANKVRMAIVKQRDKSTNVLINRSLLSDLGYVVSSRQTHILTPEMEKIKIV
jgi:glutathione synthase/RimK-type ligase-like ATP-grasp enzyme